ncbi:MAG: hypothetical protein GC179_01320 [Anaerolineaceae bacterium]|nr:hypothetical protein [Anaerolineaceae bacterium]
MSLKRVLSVVLVILACLPVAAAYAQDTPVMPSNYKLNGITHIPQHWNNCGPATLTMGLTYYGLPANQDPAAGWLKPTSEDGNVSPWQMVAYVNTQLGSAVKAVTRAGGDLDTIKTLLSNNFPVIIEEGYDPEPDRLGWMGHYLLMVGYDDVSQMITSYDSYLGPNKQVKYDDITKYWEHFNNTYIVLYDAPREAELMTLLGTNADPIQNALNALEINRQRALADAGDKFAWFNMGTNYVALADLNPAAYQPKAFEYAAAAYDKARELNLPWRMLWYQFGPYEAYNAVGRYQDVIDLVHVQLKEPGTSQYIEETYYYAGVAREGMGDLTRALSNYQEAVRIDPNFTPAIDARNRLQATNVAGAPAGNG